ncbi:hypothetical protein RJ639_015549 [Escallonia herrerae]|uniref:RNase H type-1 domain-containing protein n=1 Tax=Escallonia herrerae TaxID=1293975 RepID=A0AA88VG14_9ASTE|nr:hypothetical protein RJ639_015549 [Escallonia herrerae]
MAAAPTSTHHSHLDPDDLRLRLISRLSYSHKYRSRIDLTYDPKEKSGEHTTKSGSCYRRDPSVEGSTNSSPDKLPRSTPEYCSRERDSWKVIPKHHSPERYPPREESGYSLSEAIERAKLPPNFRMPQCDLYYGTGDPEEHVYSQGVIALPVSIGTPPTQENLMLDFVVVRVPSAYNAILGRPALNQLQAIVSTYHLKIKFPTEYGIGEVKGDQTTSRQCYVTSCDSKNEEALIIEDLQKDTKTQRGEPVEDLLSIEVYPGEENKTVRIGSNLKEDSKLELVNLLRTYADIFAWTAADMPEIDPESHTIVLLMDQPLRKVLLSPDALGRLINWSVELGEFDIKYNPRTTIKAQALADFIIECTLFENPPQLVISEAPDPWNLYEDGSSAIGSSGAGIIFISPEGFVVEYAFCFRFQASNNEAEYEALLMGIRLAHALKIDLLYVHSDSQLVVNHVLGDYEARDERMAHYI